MKRLMNLRVFLILAIAMLVASTFVTYVFITNSLRLIIFSILVALFAVLLIISIIYKFKFLYLFSAVLLFMSIPFINVYFRSKNLDKNYKFNESEVTVYGKFSENFSYTTSGNLKLTLDDVYIISNGETHKIDGKIQLYTNPSNFNLDDFKLGRYISASTELTFYFLDGNSSSMFYLNRNIVASGYALFYEITFTDDYNITLRDSIRNFTLEYLNKFDVEYSEIGYAMIFGDTSFIDGNVIETFRNTGIAHILAVSGLHVSLIVGILSFILKKLKVPNKVNFVIFGITLLFYSYLCNFSVSVIRAALMSMFVLYASIRGKAYDNLSVLSFVAVLILLVDPLKMYNISFVLSFSAVLSIILLASPIKRFLFRYFKPKMASTLSLNLAVQFGLLVINAYYFERYQLLGLLCNLISVPLSMFSFIILIIGMAISAILPFMSFICDIYGYLMGLVVKFNHYISSLGFVIDFLEFNVLAIVLMLVVMFVLSDYIFVKRNKKIATCLVVLISSMLCYLMI